MVAYHPLINEYFEGEKPFTYPHPMTGEDVEWRVIGLDFGLDAAEIECDILLHGGDGVAHAEKMRQAVSLSKLLDILQHQA